MSQEHQPATEKVREYLEEQGQSSRNPNGTEWTDGNGRLTTQVDGDWVKEGSTWVRKG